MGTWYWAPIPYLQPQLTLSCSLLPLAPSSFRFFFQCSMEVAHIKLVEAFFSFGGKAAEEPPSASPGDRTRAASVRGGVEYVYIWGKIEMS